MGPQAVSPPRRPTRSWWGSIPTSHPLARTIDQGTAALADRVWPGDSISRGLGLCGFRFH